MPIWIMSRSGRRISGGGRSGGLVLVEIDGDAYRGFSSAMMRFMLSSDEVLDGGAPYGGGASCSSSILSSCSLFALNNFILFFALLKVAEVLQEGTFSFMLAAMNKIYD